MKILLLGLSGSGKSTIAKIISQKFNLEIIEADDEVRKANNGIWPIGNDELIGKVFNSTNLKVLNLDQILYVISWMDKEMIKKFHSKGFLVFELHAEYDELLRRKRIHDYIDNKMKKKFQNTYVGYFQTVLSDEIKDLYDLSIDTTHLSPEEIFSKMVSVLK
jgi:broad-specificity NMP kinase